MKIFKKAQSWLIPKICYPLINIFYRKVNYFKNVNTRSSPEGTRTLVSRISSSHMTIVLVKTMFIMWRRLLKLDLQCFSYLTVEFSFLDFLNIKWRLLYKDFTGKIKYFVRFLECMSANLRFYSTVGFYIFLLIHIFMVMDFLTKILIGYFFSALNVKNFYVSFDSYLWLEKMDLKSFFFLKKKNILA